MQILHGHKIFWKHQEASQMNKKKLEQVNSVKNRQRGHRTVCLILKCVLFCSLRHPICSTRRSKHSIQEKIGFFLRAGHGAYCHSSSSFGQILFRAEHKHFPFQNHSIWGDSGVIWIWNKIITFSSLLCFNIRSFCSQIIYTYSRL